jgi:hypothetical protein
MTTNIIRKAAAVTAVLPLLALAGVASAQTSTTTTTGTFDPTTGTYTTTAAPNTGAGANAAVNYALMGVSALALVGAGVYLSRERLA